jgi:hypothetical protein
LKATLSARFPVYIGMQQAPKPAVVASLLRGRCRGRPPLPWQHVTTVPSPRPTRRYHAVEPCCAHARSVVTARPTTCCRRSVGAPLRPQRVTAVVGGWAAALRRLTAQGAGVHTRRGVAGGRCSCVATGRSCVAGGALLADGTATAWTSMISAASPPHFCSSCFFPLPRMRVGHHIMDCGCICVTV